MSVKIIAVRVPDYTLAREPDYPQIGKPVDEAVENGFPDGEYIIRAIGKDDHPAKTLDELVAAIVEAGTDKYDPGRMAVSHEEFSGYDYDIQAGAFEIRNGKIVFDDSYNYPTLFGDLAYDFYRHAPLDRGYPVRIDILMIYDAKALERAEKRDPKAPGVRPPLEHYLYKFKNPLHKKDALSGIVKILR